MTPKAQTLATKDSLDITSPKDGETLTSSSVPIIFTILADKSKLAQVGVDHAHIKLDGRFLDTILEGELLGFDEAPYTISDVTNGLHSIAVVLATKDHAEFEESEVAVEVTVNALETAPSSAATTTQRVPIELVGATIAAVVVAGSVGALLLRRRRKT